MNKKKYVPSDKNGPFKGALVPIDGSLSTWERRIKVSCREVGEADGGTIGLPAIIVEYSNQKNDHRRVSGVSVAFIDIGAITKDYADVWIRATASSTGDTKILANTPLRVKKNSGKIYIIKED